MKRSSSLCLAALAVVGAWSATALAADAPAKPSDCAMMRTIHSWAVLEDGTIVIATPAGQRFKVTFVGSCPDLKGANFIEVEPRASSGTCLAPGDKFVFRHSFHRSRVPGLEDSCIVKKVEGVPRAQPAAHALPPN
jgi:hypothetical protein